MARSFRPAYSQTKANCKVYGLRILGSAGFGVSLHAEVYLIITPLIPGREGRGFE